MRTGTALDDSRSRAQRYRPDIDGLRGVSVLAVLIYHAQITSGGFLLVPGGFLGVDVFFTISGFVITKAVLQEFDHTGRFSLSRFYIRRARRLLPALLAMSVVSTIFAWCILMPSQLIDFSKSIFYAISFLSNFYWLDTLTAYGAESSQLKPLLHTWTLAVEEQFYIAYPLLLLLLLPRKTAYLLIALAVISVASLITMFIIAATDWASSFYSTPTRLWQILLGAGVAVVGTQKVLRISRIHADTLLSLSLLLIFLPLLFGSLETHHPGLLTIAIALGASTAITVAPRSKCLNGALTNRVLVYFGLRSYSIYIWHFPVFSFYRNSFYDQPPLATFLLVMATLFLSEVSFRFVETPFRSRTSTPPKHFLGFLSFFLILILVPALLAIRTDGLKSRFPDLIEIYDKNEFDNSILKKRSNSIRRDLARQAGAHSVGEHEQDFLWFTDRVDTLKILIVGNSHAKNLFIALQQNKSKFPTMEFAIYRMQIAAQGRTISQLIQAENFSAADIILISTNFREDATRNDMKALPNFISKVESMGKTVVLTSNSPRFSNYNSDTVFDHLLKTQRHKVSSEMINSNYFKKLDKDVLLINNRLAFLADQRNLLFLDKFDFSCDMPMGACTGITPDGFKVYFDGEHYTIEGARYLGSVIHSTGWMRDLDGR